MEEPTMPESELLTMREAMDWLRVSRDTVEALIKQGELRSTRVGIQRRIYRQSLIDYLQRQEEKENQ
jgi:excisionase family DNA binding protein